MAAGRCASILVLMAFALSCAGAPRYCKTLPAHQVGEPIEMQERRLHCAYREGSDAGLEAFISGWMRDSQPISESELESLEPPLRDAYLVLEEFYTFDWFAKSFPGSEAKSELTRAACIPVEDRVRVSGVGELENFRPRGRSEVGLCYLDSRYQSLIERFLTLAAYPDGTETIRTSPSESWDRLRFIGRRIPFFDAVTPGVIRMPAKAFAVSLAQTTTAYVDYSFSSCEYDRMSYRLVAPDRWTPADIE